VVDDKVLLTVRAREPEKGRLDVPGGFLMAGEDPLTGLRRELREELHVEIGVGYSDFVQAVPHRYGMDGDFVLSLGFRARLVRGEPRPADDVADVMWVAYSQLDDLDFAWPHDRSLVAGALRRSRWDKVEEGHR
jgi:ADP-ribose pyrophosphatase YjhB (NUDIX family)